MNYEKELNFFQKILENYRINSCIMTDGDTSYRMADRGLRDSLGLSEDYDQLFCTRHEALKENTIFLLTDNFSCNYIFIVLKYLVAFFVTGYFAFMGGVSYGI